MHARRSLAGAVIMGAFAAMAFAGASAGAPAQSAATPPPGATPFAKSNIAGKSLTLTNWGRRGSLSSRAGKVERNPYKAFAQGVGSKANVLAGMTNRDVPNAKLARSMAISGRSPAQAAAASIAADQPIGGKEASVLASTGVNAYEQELYGGYNLEPPDPSVCAGAGKVVQVVNSQVQISDTNLHKLSAPISMESFFGDFTNIMFDPLCSYSPDTGRWFLTEAVTDFASFSGVYIAVSTSSDPFSPWNIYYLDLGTFGGAGGCAAGLCLADQPNLGMDKYTISISTNQFDLGAGCVSGFCGAAYVLIDKVALGMGNPFPNAVGFDLSWGGIPFPDWVSGDCIAGFGACWYSIQPADSPNAMYDNRFGGTQYALSALDFFGLGDNRIAVWGFFNTSSIGAFIPNIVADVVNNLSTGSTYYAAPPMAGQPQNPTSPVTANGNPLGDFLVLVGACPPGSPPPGCGNPGPIATNDQRMRDTSAVRTASGDTQIWGGLNTAVATTAGTKAGIALFGVHVWDGGFVTLTNKAYISTPYGDVMFPAIANLNNGAGLVAYTLSGIGYPSSAYSKFSPSVAPGTIRIANQGLGVQDGFTQYDAITGFYRPRWGDYSGAATSGNAVYFTSEFIPKANCSLSQFTAEEIFGGGATCGNTRTFFANWGTSLNRASG